MNRWLADRFDRRGTLALLLALRRREQAPWLPIFTFHRVHARGAQTPFDEDAYDVEVVQLDRIAATVREHFDPIGIAELLRFAATRELPRNPVVITFDGGYRDGRDVALPILQRHGVPATFFVPAHRVAQRRMPWRDRLSYTVKMSPCEQMTVSWPEPRTFDLATPHARTRAIAELLPLALAAPDLPRFLDELAHAAGTPWTDELDRAFAGEHVLTWDHARELRAAGMDVQVHADSLYVTAGELSAARELLARELGSPVRALSHAGTAPVADAGFSLGFTGGGVQSLVGVLDPLALRRIGVELATAPALARAAVAAPSRAA
jgi:peptidoglycan/xylan/chitin deacetylase (PgdA/CDA1 family)